MDNKDCKNDQSPLDDYELKNFDCHLPATPRNPELQNTIVTDEVFISHHDRHFGHIFDRYGNNEWTPERIAEAENHQYNSLLSVAAQKFGCGSNQVRDIVNARARGDPLPKPGGKSATVGIKPEINISDKLIEQLSLYDEEELNRDLKKAQRNFKEAMAKEDPAGDCANKINIKKLSRPITFPK